MPRTCTICRHGQRVDVDAALLAGEPLRDVARRFATTKDALFRHRQHVPASLAKAHQAAEVAHGDDLLAEVRRLQGDAARIARAAEEQGDLRTALQGTRELARHVELLARLAGELREGAAVTVAVVTAAPEWEALRSRLLAALDRHPEARADVLAALEGAGAS